MDIIDRPPTKVGERFSQYIKDHKLSQVSVATRAGVRTDWLNRVLRGHQDATFLEWTQLADAAGVPAAQLAVWLYPSEFAEESQAYSSTQDDPGAYELRRRVMEVLKDAEKGADGALFRASDHVKWTVGAAAFIAHRVVMMSPESLAIAVYFYGRVLQDLNLPFRAQWALEGARLIDMERSGPSGELSPYVELSLANLAIERGRITEGIALFGKVRRLHDKGVRVLTVPRQLAHLLGFAAEAQVLDDIETMGVAPWGHEDANKLKQHETDISNAAVEAKKADRPIWQRRFSGTRGLVRVGQGDHKRGLAEIQVAVKAYVTSDHSPAEVDTGAYLMAIHALAYLMAKLPLPVDVKKGFLEAERLALRDSIFVVMRICRLARKIAPLAFALMLLLALLEPGLAFAGNGCES